MPLPHRETVRSLAREIDHAIAGFVRGQSGVCLILGSFYALGLSLTGLNFGLLIGLVSGIISFVPYVGSLTGLVLSLGVAIAQFWPEWTPIIVVACVFFVGKAIITRLRILQAYGIPEPVIRGFACALIITAIYYITRTEINFDISRRDVFLIYFFAALGLRSVTPH